LTGRYAGTVRNINPQTKDMVEKKIPHFAARFGMQCQAQNATCGEPHSRFCNDAARVTS